MSTIGPREPTWDREAVRAPEADGIDHSASAKNNLKEVIEDLKNTVKLDKTAHAVERAVMGAGGHSVAGVVSVLATGVAKDVADIVVGPAKALKDTADAAVHGLLGAIRRP